jgi:hypothetical protein
MNPEALKNRKTSKSKLLKRIGNRVVEFLLLVWRFIKWFVFGNVAIYVATRVINFLEDPYMDDWSISGYYQDELLIMAIQTIFFILLFSLLVSLYKLLFKKDYRWQTFFVIIVSMIFVIYGVFF